jgi:hypothetical protein
MTKEQRAEFGLAIEEHVDAIWEDLTFRLEYDFDEAKVVDLVKRLHRTWAALRGGE